MIRFMSAAALIAGFTGFVACKAGSERNQIDTSAGGVAPPAAAPAPTPSGAARVDTAAGTVAPPASAAGRDSASSRADTTRANTGGKVTSSAGNQTQSGVTNAKTGKSTLGSGVKKTEPTQGQPVTSKGDTLARRKKP